MTDAPTQPAGWLTAAEVGKMIGRTARQVRERIALRPDFPRPVRIEERAHPRWVEAEVRAWMARQERKRAA